MSSPSIFLEDYSCILPVPRETDQNVGMEPIDFRISMPGSRCAVIHLPVIDQFDLRNKTAQRRIQNFR